MYVRFYVFFNFDLFDIIFALNEKYQTRAPCVMLSVPRWEQNSDEDKLETVWLVPRKESKFKEVKEKEERPGAIFER